MGGKNNFSHALAWMDRIESREFVFWSRQFFHAWTQPTRRFTARITVVRCRIFQSFERRFRSGKIFFTNFARVV